MAYFKQFVAWEQLYIGDNIVRRFSGTLSVEIRPTYIIVDGEGTHIEYFMVGGRPTPLIKDHKYYIHGPTGDIGVYFTYMQNSGYNIGETIKTADADYPDNYIALRIHAVPFNSQKIRIMVFDLTKMYGAGKEPDLVTCQSIFNLPYYMYNIMTL